MSKFLTKKEFVNYSGLKSEGNLYQYISRQKIVAEPDGTIDIEKKQNQEWLKYRASKGLCPGFTSATLGVEPSAKQEVQQPKGKSISVDNTLVNPVELSKTTKKKVENAVSSRYEVELEKLKAELEKKLVDTELAREKLATIKGNNIPIEIVKEIMAQLSKVIINNYKTYTEQMISETCHKFRIEDSDRVKLISQSVNSLNKIHEKAVNDARKQFKTAIGATQNQISFQEDNEND